MNAMVPLGVATNGNVETLPRLFFFFFLSLCLTASWQVHAAGWNKLYTFFRETTHQKDKRRITVEYNLQMNTFLPKKEKKTSWSINFYQAINTAKKNAILTLKI